MPTPLTLASSGTFSVGISNGLACPPPWYLHVVSTRSRTHNHGILLQHCTGVPPRRTGAGKMRRGRTMPRPEMTVRRERGDEEEQSSIIHSSVRRRRGPEGRASSGEYRVTRTECDSYSTYEVCTDVLYGTVEISTREEKGVKTCQIYSTHHTPPVSEGRALVNGGLREGRGGGTTAQHHRYAVGTEGP